MALKKETVVMIDLRVGYNMSLSGQSMARNVPFYIEVVFFLPFVLEGGGRSDVVQSMIKKGYGDLLIDYVVRM